MCGGSPTKAHFNDEHVIPDWILRRYNLHNRVITLPNKAQFRYDQFKIPCCQKCNRALGERVEQPIREMFNKGYKAFCEELEIGGPWNLFCWMCLIFLKTHLKDNCLRLHQDKRKGEQKIGELHSWNELHHIHCLSRAFYTGCDIKIEALGSLLVVPAKKLKGREEFDYCDLSFAQTMLLRLDEIAVIAVLDDSQASLSVIHDFIKGIGGPLSPLQLRELALRMAAINIHLAERPSFASDINALTEEYEIRGIRPKEISIEKYEHETLGTMMHHICEGLVIEHDDKAKVLENIKTGLYSFIYDDTGKFFADAEL
jgi:hypothetical protein